MLNSVKSKVKVSIIIPVYNVEKYLRECLDSVVNQTLKDIEIICINDGSKDNSLEILKEYSQKDKRIKIISKENEGLSITRNRGIDIACGEYIGFVDSDDYIEKDMFEKLYDKAKNNNLDIAMCRLATYDENTQEVDKNKWYFALKCFGNFNKEIFNHEDTKEFTHFIAVTAYNKIYKRTFLNKNNFKFPEKLLFEDEVFFYNTYLKAKRVSFVKETLYYYRINSGESIISSSDKDFRDVIKVFKLIRDALNKNNQPKSYKQKVYNRFFHLVLLRYSQTSQKYKKDFWNNMKKDFESLIVKDNNQNEITNNDDKILFSEIDNYLKERINKILDSDSYEIFEEKDLEKKFSVIMPFYNCEKYLAKSINNVINQSISFVHNIELILINDGSTDESEQIALKYVAEYPYNIKVLNQENKGPSSARNYGLTQAHGKYVNFVDSDDFYTLDTLENVYNFFEDNKELEIVAIPIEYIERKNIIDPLNYKFKEDAIIDLNKNPTMIQTSITSTFIKKDILNNETFDENLKYSEDTFFINKLLLNTFKLGVLKSPKYYARSRNDYSALSDHKFNDKWYYTERFTLYYKKLIDYSKKKCDVIPAFIQQLLVYDLEVMLRNLNLDLFNNNSEKKDFWINIKNIISKIDASVFKDNFNLNILNEDFVQYLLKSNLNYFELDMINNNNFISKNNINDKECVINISTIIRKEKIMILNGFLKINYSDDLNIVVEAFYNNKFIQKFDVTQINLISEQNTENYRIIEFNVNIPLNYISFDLKFKVLNCNLNIDIEPKIKISDYPNSNIIKIDNYSIRFLNEILIESFNCIFSIIIPIYNCEKYIHQCLKSIINQKMTFSDNVQVILIDDGSNDNSLKILYEYYSKYPKNLILISKKHEGQVKARNIGLNYINGSIVNFLDADDYITNNTLLEVNNFYTNHKDIVDVVSIPIKYFDLLEKNLVNYEKDQIIDLNENYLFRIKSISASFIKKTALNNHNFNENLNVSEGVCLLNEILLNKQKIGVLKNPCYYYRKHYSHTNIEEIKLFDKTYYLDRLDDFHIYLIKKCEKMGEPIPKFIQYCLFGDLKILIEDNYYSLDNQDFNTFLSKIRFIMSKIDKDILQKACDKNELINYNYLKNDTHDCEIYTMNESKANMNTLINLTNIRINENQMKIKGIISSLANPETTSIYLKIGKSQYEIINNRWFLNKKFELNIPIEKIIEPLKFYVENNLSSKEINLCQISYDNIKISNNTIDKTIYVKSDNQNNNNNKVNEISIKISNKYKFLVSVIITFYNSQNYIKKAIESVINQTLNFEKFVQLILIDDGSEDKSYNIALDYFKRYPNNIVLMKQENQGQAKARNNAIHHVQGKYVNFLDSDDYISSNTLKKVCDFYDKHYNEVDVVAIPIKLFERESGNHVLNDKFDHTRIIDLTKEPCNPQLSSSSAFFKSESLEYFNFPTNIIFSEDAMMINKLLLEKKKLGIVTEATYYYRKRSSNDSTIDTVNLQKEYYIDKLKYYFMDLIEYSLLKEGNVPGFIQHTLAYDLQWVIQQPSLDILNENEKREFWYYLNKVMYHIGYGSIMNNRFIKNKLRRTFLLYLRYKKINYITERNDVQIKIGGDVLDSLKNHNMWIDLIEINNGYINISGFYNSLFDKDHISICAEVINENSKNFIFEGKFIKYCSNARKDVVFLDNIWEHHINYDIEIPLKELNSANIKIRVNYHKDGDKTNYHENNLIYSYLNLKLQKHVRISNIDNYIVKDDYILTLNNNIFQLEKYSYIKMIKNEMEVIKKIRNTEHNNVLYLHLLYLIVYPFIKFIYRNKEIWFFMDRWNVADDNATHLFKYAINQKDNIKKFLILSKNSNEYNEMSKIGNVLEPKSFKHKFWYLFADKIMSTQPYEFQLNPFYNDDNNKDTREYFNGKITSKTYFLQHGVTKDNISSWLHKYDLNLALVSTVSDLERKSILNECYNYKDNVVQTLGFPRYDNLSQNTKTKKQILISPSWRSYLDGNKNYFVNSNYLKELNNLLNNEELIEIAEEYGYKIVFKSHPNLYFNITPDTTDKYINYVKINDKIIESTKESYNQLFRESSIMITDYSSVFFDFAYLKKPIIYYRPNDDYHYAKTYFDYETMGFGDIIDNPSNLILKIKEYIRNECVMEDKYIKRVDSFFKYTDRNNSKRVYNWIKKN